MHCQWKSPPGLFRRRRRGRFRRRYQPPPERLDRRDAGIRIGPYDQPQLQPLTTLFHPARTRFPIKINLLFILAVVLARFLDGFFRASRGESHAL